MFSVCGHRGGAIVLWTSFPCEKEFLLAYREGRRTPRSMQRRHSIKPHFAEPEPHDHNIYLQINV